MKGIPGDIAYAFRQFRREPGFALIVVLTLGGAMGVSTALFAVVNSSMFQPWPVSDPGRVVVASDWVSLDEARYWADRTRLFESMASRRFGAANQRIEGRRVLLDFVSTNYFEVVGIPLIAGRTFARDYEGTASEGFEAVISHRTWQLHFGGDPQVVGRLVPLEGQHLRIVGIAAPGFDGTAGGFLRTHMWLPLSAVSVLQPKIAAGNEPEFAEVFGRLSAGAGTSFAEAELRSLSAHFRSEHGIAPDPTRLPLRLTSTDSYSRQPPGAQSQARSYALLLAVAFLTLIACANVSNLLLARGHARRGEIAVRFTLGASRAEIVRQLLIEAFLLALGAGAVGLAVAAVLPEHIFASVPDLAEMMQLSFRPDFRVFLWTLGVSSLACIVFGLAPALQSTRLNLSQILKDSNGVAAPSLRTSLTSMQALVSVLALAVAGMVLRSEPHVQARRFARAMEGIAVIRPEFPKTHDRARRGLIMRNMVDGLGASVGEPNVAATSREPRSGPSGDQLSVDVSPTYFNVLDLPFVAGRTFTKDDPADRVAIVNEGLARSLWRGENAIGKALAATSTSSARVVVGVVRDSSTGDLVAYRPLVMDDAVALFVRGGRNQVRQSATALASSLDRETRIDVIAGPAWATRSLPLSALTARLFGEFGALALVLGTTGLFSLSEYAVRQRTRELGIRRALGAGHVHVLAAVLRPALRSLATGLAAGAFSALCAGFTMRYWDLPSGVDPLDVTNYVTVALIIGAAALVAIWRPSRQAMRVEPCVALRYE